jgi:hypothetical protein
LLFAKNSSLSAIIASKIEGDAQGWSYWDFCWSHVDFFMLKRNIEISNSHNKSLPMILLYITTFSVDLAWHMLQYQMSLVVGWTTLAS